MTIDLQDRKVEDIGTWQEVFVRTCSDRIKKAIDRALTQPEICLERARVEMKTYEQFEDEPRIIQRARVLERYLRDKTIFILEDELIVGNITSKVRASPIFGELSSKFIDEELDHPERDFQIRKIDEHIIHPEERKELREVIIPYFKGKSLQEYIYAAADEDVKEKAFVITSSCGHIPNYTDLMVQSDHGHMMPNWDKVLAKGLKGIREEVEWYLAELEQPYMHYDVQSRKDFYQAALISLDAAMAYAQRYADLARQMATEETDSGRKAELEKIAEACEWVPANPARDWWDALQSVWMIQAIIHCELNHWANNFLRFDQYMYPYYRKSMEEDKSVTREEALELLECFWVKCNEYTKLFNYETVWTNPGYGVSQNLLLGGQTRDGQDACNEVTMLCMDAEEQVGLIQPEIAMRVWEGTPHEYLRKAVEIVRLGRGKMKFYGDRQAIQMQRKNYPDLPIEDLRDYAVQGCVEICLPHITMEHSYTGLFNAAKIVELVLNNGKCALCGRQMGPLTGDPRDFQSMAAVKKAYQEQISYWMEYMFKGVKVQMEAQAKFMQTPFCSCIMEGPLQKGVDLIEGGAWHTLFGLLMAGVADSADALAVIDKLIYRDEKITWDELLEAVEDNWEGHENLRQLCINSVPKYGNDNDYADDFAAFVMDTWYDTVDWANMRKDLVPAYGGRFSGATIIGNAPVGFGLMTGALPGGHEYPHPIADTMSPVQGMDKNGPTAVIKSVAKMPAHRFTMGTSLNQRLSPQLLATDRDLDNFVAFLRAAEEMGIFHIQFNVISSEHLRKAIKEPEKYKDLMVRVASYCAYFVELDPATQQDIIARSEQQGW